jgi:hypothetical protein
MNLQKIYGQYSLVLNIHENAPKRVILEAHFPNPAAPDKVKVVIVRAYRGTSRVRLQSPGFKGFQCRNYQVVVYVSDARDPDTNIGTHYQYIQSPVDLTRIRTSEQLLSALIYGNCGDAR